MIDNIFSSRIPERRVTKKIKRAAGQSADLSAVPGNSAAGNSWDSVKGASDKWWADSKDAVHNSGADLEGVLPPH